MKTTNVNDLLFEVEKVAAPTNALSSCAYDVFAHVNGSPIRLNSCSERYELIPNANIFPAIRKLLLSSNYSNFSEQYTMQDYSLFTAKYILEDMNITIKSKTDKIKPTIVIRHSYNGVWKYSIKFGFYRLICSNGLTVPVKELDFANLEIGGKHTISVRKSFELLQSRLEYVVNNLDLLTNGFNLLAGEVVTNWTDKVIEVMGQAGIKKGTDLIISTIANESNAHYGGEVNNWLIYNGINQYIYNDELNSKLDHVRESIDRNVLSLLMQ